MPITVFEAIKGNVSSFLGGAQVGIRGTPYLSRLNSPDPSVHHPRQPRTDQESALPSVCWR